MQNCERCIVRDANILSLQDTLLWSGRVFASNCYIEGNVDFIWGTGAAYFIDCELKTVGRSGYNVQARNDGSSYGYVFVASRLTSDPGLTGNWLARVDSSVYPSSHVAYIDCELGPHIDPRGFQVTGGGTSSVRFWEYRSRTPAGSPVDTSQRSGGCRQLTSDEAAEMRDPSVVLDGWDPE
jgi:pectin methylesterase-like acyl-CoA thioesterase